MTKRTAWFLTTAALIAVVALTACGDPLTPPDDGEPRIGISLLAAECPDYIGSTNIAQNLGSLAIQFYDAGGKIVQIKGKNAVSFTSEQLAAGKVEITGIPAMTGARVVFSGFEPGNTSTPKWRGEARGITFVKGKDTKVKTVLYPLTEKGCFPYTLIKKRFGHAAALLPDGRILISGGFVERQNAIWVATDSVELLDPETGTIDQIAEMGILRALHHMTVLPDGRVLIAGGVRQLEVAKKSVTDYPDLPLTLTIPTNGIDLYTVNFPKLNQRTDSQIDQSTTEFINTDTDQYLAYQSYAYVMTDPVTGAGTLFMVGGVKDGAAQSKIYGAEIAISEGSVTAALNEYHSDKTETFVMPVVVPAGVDEFGNPRILVVGGHKATTTGKFAHLITKDAYSDWAHDAANLFASSSSVDAATGNILVVGGLSLPKDATDFSLNGAGYLFDPTLAAQKSGALYWGTWLEGAVLSLSDGYFTIVGGFNSFDVGGTTLEAANFFEYVSTDTMAFVEKNPETEKPYYGGTRVKRGFHSTIATTAGSPMIYIIGGTPDLKGTEDSLETTKIIELMPIANPF